MIDDSINGNGFRYNLLKYIKLQHPCVLILDRLVVVVVCRKDSADDTNVRLLRLMMMVIDKYPLTHDMLRYD